MIQWNHKKILLGQIKQEKLWREKKEEKQYKAFQSMKLTIRESQFSQIK
jgi:hypothetical protein